MGAVRRNIVDAPQAAASFVSGVLALKAEQLGPTTADFGIAGPPVPVSTYDLFVVWHQTAMMRMTPPSQSDRNAAHSGPVFLPWHRLMLLLFELQLQRVLADPDVGLPYWDWGSDGDLSVSEQRRAPLWSADRIGGSESPVPDGPFATPQFRVRIESDAVARLRSTDRPLRRDLGTQTPRLPSTADVDTVLATAAYDTVPWDRSTLGFRNRVEGWRPSGPALHNRVHVWVGGDMLPGTSPNDPVFYLNHCNVDRIWEGWQQRHGRSYQPAAGTPGAPVGHRADDPLYALLIRGRVRPVDLLDVSEFATYDALP